VAVIVAFIVATVVALFVWLKRSSRTAPEAMSELRLKAGDLARLPIRLHRVAADSRTPRVARWCLLGLAVYVASPIDLIPDFLPGIGYLDEIVLVPLALRRIRRMIPDEVWNEQFPSRRNDNG
jgi:uncharacterized membrane protein YkvA (DUF1232 family)